MNKFSSMRSSLLVAAFLASSSLASAQTGPAAGGKAPAAAEQAAPREGVELSVPVQGLTKENADQVKSSLEAITREFYTCAPCNRKAATAGKCPGCKGDRASKKEPVLKRIEVTADKGVIALATNPGAELRLSAIERALEANSVTLDDQKLALSGDVQLIFRDGASAEESIAVQKALEGAKLFRSFRARFDPTAKETVVYVSGGSSTATRSAIARALEQAGSKSRPSDIVWGGIDPWAC